MINKYYTVKEAAKYLGLAEQTIRNYLIDGRLEGDKIYNSTVISLNELDKYKEVRRDIDE